MDGFPLVLFTSSGDLLFDRGGWRVSLFYGVYFLATKSAVGYAFAKPFLCSTVALLFPTSLLGLRLRRSEPPPNVVREGDIGISPIG